MSVTTTANQVNTPTQYVTPPEMEKRKPGRPKMEKTLNESALQPEDAKSTSVIDDVMSDEMKVEDKKVQQAMPGAGYASTMPTNDLINKSLPEIAKKIGTGRIYTLNGRKFAEIGAAQEGLIKAVGLDDIGTCMNRIMTTSENGKYEKKYGKQWVEDVKQGILPEEWEKELPIVSLDVSQTEEYKRKQAGVLK